VRVACSGRSFATQPADYDAVKDYVKPQISGGAAPAGTVPLVAAYFALANPAKAAVVVLNVNAAAVDTSVAVEPSAGGEGGSLPLALPPHSISTLTFAI
jgi:hypothetical protein